MYFKSKPSLYSIHELNGHSGLCKAEKVELDTVCCRVEEYDWLFP